MATTQHNDYQQLDPEAWKRRGVGGTKGARRIIQLVG